MQYDIIKKEIIKAHNEQPNNAGAFDFYNYLKTKPAYFLGLMLRDNETPTKLRDEIIFYLDRGK
jgi:hypothetical protein